MAQLQCDTTKVNEVGNKIVLEASELASLFDELYKKLYSIQKDGVWLGYASNHFLTNISNDKNDIDKFIQGLIDYGNLLTTYANNLDSVYNKYKRNV